MPVKLLPFEKLAACETLIVGVGKELKVPAGLPAPASAALKRLLTLGDLKGKADEVHVLYPEGGAPRRVIAVGLGPLKELQAAGVRRALGRGVRRAQDLKARDAVLVLDGFALPGEEEAAVARTAAWVGTLALYKFLELKSPAKPGEQTAFPRLFLACRRPAACARPAAVGEILGGAANFARTLGNRPGNQLYPQVLAQEARGLARRHSKISVSVMLPAQLAKAGFGALAAVGAGSAHPPVLIEIKYSGGRPQEAPVALVGKGITFDSGGISLKPAAKMEDMKFDMCGAAAVLGTLQAAAELNLPVNLVGVIPAAENLPSGSAARPGDVVRSFSGQTVEIVNTDAEGRLILADGLAYALRHEPAQIIDLATLTGAVVVALGNAATGLISNHDGLAAEIILAGEQSGERVWRLPLWDEYRDLLKSEVADLSNMGSRPGAGTIVGGAFLEKFVGETPWVHLDIAGTAYSDGDAIYAKGATGVGIRLLVEWLEKTRPRKG
jgi:leucyl aminopeptidase